jgi:hypothetical protein
MSDSHLCSCAPGAPDSYRPTFADCLKAASPAAHRIAWLKGLGVLSRGELRRFTTADVVRDSETGDIYIVADPAIPETSEEEAEAAADWRGVCDILDKHWNTGNPLLDDIGEPFYDGDHRVWAWDLSRAT